MKRACQIFVLNVCVASALQAQRGGLSTQFSRSGDTTIARVNGAVPASAVKRLVETMRIQPTADDTMTYSSVYDIVVDRQGRVWAFDDDIMSVFLFDASGKLVRRIGRKGGGPGEFQGLDGMAFMRDGRFVQLDLSNGRISFFSTAGDFLTSWPVPATSFFGGSNLVVDTTDAIRLKWRGKFEDNVANQLLVHLRTGGGGFAADTIVFPKSPINNQAFIVQGARSIGLGIPFQPSFRWDWQWGGGVVTANGQTGALMIAQPGGRVVRVVRNAPQVRVTTGEREQAEANLLAGAKSVDANWNGALPAIPATKPIFGGFFPARDGRIWVSMAGEAERIPQSERATPRPGRPAFVNEWRSKTVFEVYDRNGTFLGRVPFERQASFIHAFGDEVWMRETTADGFTAIVKYRIEPPLN